MHRTKKLINEGGGFACTTYILNTKESFESMLECNLRITNKYRRDTSDAAILSFIVLLVMISFADFLPTKKPFSLFKK